MKQLYVALNSTEAHIISHLLQNDGIDARVQGDYLQGAVGGLPTTGHIRVVVPDEDYERAQHVLKEFQEANMRVAVEDVHESEHEDNY